MIAVGIYLQTLRDEAGLNQTKAASAVGMSQKTVERWEAGENEPSLTTLVPYLESLRGSLLRTLSLLFEPNVAEHVIREYARADRARSDQLIAEERRLMEQFTNLTGERRQTAIQVLRQLLAAEGQQTEH